MNEHFVGWVDRNGDLYIDRPRGYVDPLVRTQTLIAAMSEKLRAILTPAPDDTPPDQQ